MRGYALLLVAAVSFLLFTVGATDAAQPAGPRWVLTDLGTLGGVFGSAVDVNEKGQIVGMSLTKRGERHPFLWENGRMTDLGDIGDVIAINDRGQILGHRQVWKHVALADRLVASRSFVWERGRITTLAPIGGRNVIDARAINDRGQVIGVTLAKSGPWHGFFWDAGHMTDLGAYDTPVALNNRGRVLGFGSAPFLWQHGKTRDLVGGCTTVSAMNERGQIVGGIESRGGPDGHAYTQHACLWQNGKRTTLPTLGGDAFADLVNDRGWIVGRSSVTNAAPRVPHYVVWRNGKLTDLGAFENAWVVPSEIFGMNNRGQIIWSVDDYRSQHVFVWDAGRTMKLPTLGGKEVKAAAINDRGQIVGSSQMRNRRDMHVVMWTRRTGA